MSTSEFSDRETEQPRNPEASVPEKAAGEQPERDGPVSDGEERLTGHQIAGRLGDAVSCEARTVFHEQKGRAVKELDDASATLRRTGTLLQEEGHPSAGRYAEEMARQVERLRSGLQDAEMEDVLGSIREFARREPGIFIGGAFAAGFLLARFLKSSAPDTEPDGREDAAETDSQ